MKDARWTDVMTAAASCARHLRRASTWFETGRFHVDGSDDDGHDAMAVMHAAQSGYTSLETAILRVMQILDEEPPSGPDWHAQLIARASYPLHGRRGAIISPEMERSARKLRGFRHWAMHGYDIPFHAEDAADAIQAGRSLAGLVEPTFESFARAIDP